jgi:hypothetical protein
MRRSSPTSGVAVRAPGIKREYYSARGRKDPREERDKQREKGNEMNARMPNERAGRSADRSAGEGANREG